MPIKFFILSDIAPKTYKAGNGSVIFRITNMRTSCRFYILTGGAQFPDVLGYSNAIAFDNANVPTGVHLALPYKHSVKKGNAVSVASNNVSNNNNNNVLKRSARRAVTGAVRAAARKRVKATAAATDVRVRDDEERAFIRVSWTTLNASKPTVKYGDAVGLCVCVCVYVCVYVACVCALCVCLCVCVCVCVCV